ncbi:Flp family type IVb pilin [Jannaschia ovalis]|uniref:Pilus assembly protein n=1 Tax=Jannaschia ovalis TaxID=3038773 RepID=A0ABY8LH02_9RHOB|nr:hypothetical protein [Jannaschia sp. GRR-S6-38]WGH80446.1 hypothetical protein P8627_05680 [Jannaschia sp. GRR-S6-38]
MFSAKFLRDEQGAVTVDWVVLTAAMVALGLAVMATVSRGVQATVTDIDANMNAPSVITRMNHGFGYAAHNQRVFNGLLTDMAGMPDDDLDQVAAYFNAVAEADLSGADDDTLGQLADFNAAIDMAYVDGGRTRPTETQYDEAELARISTEMGYDQGGVVQIASAD